MKYTAKRLLTALLASVMLFSVACEKKDDKKSNNSTTTEQDIEISFAVSEDAVSDEESNEEPTKEESYIRKLSLGYDIDEGAPILDGDVIVIQLNSTAAFAVDAGVMPSLSDFAEKGMYYSNFYAQQGADEGIYSMLTSLYAPINGYKEDAAYHSLAKLFADNGYKVYGSTVSCSDGMAKALGIAQNLPDVYDLFEDNGEKDFIFIENDSIKYPYIPESTEGVAIEGNRSLNSYLCCAENLDSGIGALLEEVAAMGDKAPTVVIYGTAPKLDGKFTEYAKEYPELFDKSFSYDQVYQTPFIIFGNGIEAAKVNNFATIYDIYPTLAALYGFKSDDMLVCGKNLYMNSKLPETGATVDVAENIALNKSYTVSVADGSAASYIFSSFSDDGVKLVDGVTDDGRGFAESEIGIVLTKCDRNHYITVDLGEEKIIDRVALDGVANNGTTHLGLKGGDFKLSVSTDGENFLDVSGDIVVRNADAGVYQSYTKALEDAVSAKYVRFAFSGDGNYLSVTEALVYEAIAETEDTVSLDDFRFFAPQGEYIRGTFVTDSVYYTKSDNTSTAYAKASMGELSARAYKEHYKYVLETINECEYAVNSGFYGNSMAYEEFYETLPSRRTLLLKAESAEGAGGSMVWHVNYLSNYSVNFAANTIDGTWNGVTLKDEKISVVEGEASGTLVTIEMSIKEFTKLYVTPVCVLNGGKVSVYASYVNDMGVNTPWLLLDKYSDGGFAEGEGFVSVDSKEGYAASKFRIKLVLEGAATVSALNITPIAMTESEALLPEIEEAVDVFVEVQNGGALDDSGIAAVETLVAGALSREPDWEKATEYIKDSKTNAGSSILARYACENGINAYIDAYGASELINAISKGQPIIIKDGDGYRLAAGYSEKGITVINALTGAKTTVAFEDISVLTEVIIVDSALNTPEIIEDIIAEDSAVRPGIIVDKKKYIVIHNTGNYAPGSTAAAHAQYLHGLSNSPDRSVSWHYTVDSKEIYHHLPDNESAWHASDGTYGEGNQFGIGIETCVNGFPNVYKGEAYEEWLKEYTVTIKNLAYLVAKLMIENDIGMEGIKQHYDFAPDKKNCPMQMRYSSASDSFVHDGDMWVYLMSQIELQYNRLVEEGYGQ